MINSPWNSSVLKQHPTATLVNEIVQVQISGRGIHTEDGVQIITPYAEKVPPFIQPLTGAEFGERVFDGVVIDGRSFTKKHPTLPGEIIINNTTQFAISLRIAQLTRFWQAYPDNRLDLMRTGDLPAQVFIAWMSYAITSKLGLDEETSRVLQILTAIYYAHLYHDTEEATSARGKEKIVRVVNRWTRHPLELIQSTVDDAGYLDTLFDYVDAVKKAFAHNTRVSQVNVGLLVSSLNNSWFGFGAQETVAVAMEYPPIFLALVEAGLNSRAFKNTRLNQVAERFSRGSAGTDFLRNLAVLVGQNKPQGSR